MLSIEPEKALPKSVFIFDDIITENQKIARTYFSRGWHNLVDVSYLAQSYSKVPKQLLRDNANFIVLFKQDETNLKHIYNEHCSGDMSYSEFKDFCTSCWRQGRFEFICCHCGNASFTVMAASGEVLGELIKAKENIKRKYTVLKQGKADIHSLVSETLSPIIEPLEKIKRFDPSTFQDPSVELKEDNIEHSVGDSFKINDWYKSYDIDKTYGSKIQANGNIHLAHLTADGTKIKRGGNKYSDLIQNIFPSGAGLSVKLQKHNLVYWNDPNELVECLKLLLASKATDYFTKVAWATPLKSKTAKEVSSAMSKTLLKRSPKLLQLDNGKEFYNSTFDALMKKHNIHKYSTYSTMKACIVECFNRTLKEKMFREFTEHGSHEWFSILPKLINEYNNSLHRIIGVTPVQADADPTTVKIKQRKIINGKIKFNGYLPSWSTEIFKIVKINETLPITFQLQEYTGKPIADCFYSKEILKTNYPNDYLVEKIIRRKGYTKFSSNEIVKSYSNKLDKIEHLLEENHKSIQIQEEQVEAVQLTCIQITEHVTRSEVSL
ncbi:Uncharacterized protein FWK35_00003046 [Aphis craccivora]|uniref:Integrase catalytic domain-containing protein n=1 Tax=Aphis craccivora TaxID=307492 RepID=A0A6G0ZJI8_APHCR|nr:Uncharacterized protein FWK35_00003046 [Aphis craccivora]